MSKEHTPLKKHLKAADIEGGTYPQFVEKLRQARAAEAGTVAIVIPERTNSIESDLKPSIKKAQQ